MASLLTTLEVPVVSALLGMPPIAIAVIAEPITNFDQHDPSRQRFSQLEFRGGLILKSTENSAASRQLSHPMALSFILSETMAGG